MARNLSRRLDGSLEETKAIAPSVSDLIPRTTQLPLRKQDTILTAEILGLSVLDETVDPRWRSDIESELNLNQ